MAFRGTIAQPETTRYGGGPFGYPAPPSIGGRGRSTGGSGVLPGMSQQPPRPPYPIGGSPLTPIGGGVPYDPTAPIGPRAPIGGYPPRPPSTPMPGAPSGMQSATPPDLATPQDPRIGRLRQMFGLD